MKVSRALVYPMIEAVTSIWPVSKLVGLASAHIAYPIAERVERRNIRAKLKELRHFYQLSDQERQTIIKERLVKTIEFASHHVPYYKDLFKQHDLDPKRVRRDINYLNKIPFLTKEIIREQADRMLARPLSEVRYHACKTGGSTGISCLFYYDQVAADYSAAVTLYARERIGKNRSKSELHFATRFPDALASAGWFTRDDLKCFAMNRTNIFFDRLDDVGLREIWKILNRRKPYLVHAHPSTIYALACYIEREFGAAKIFSIFESSGELLEPHQRQLISQALKCEVIDRYGLAELGVMAYQLTPSKGLMQVLESEGLVESIPFDQADLDSQSNPEELVITGFRNNLMPLIRYRTGDLGSIERAEQGTFLTKVVGRIHDQVPIHGINHATHHIQDILDHKVGGVQEFQIDLRTMPPKLRIVPEGPECVGAITERVAQFWGSGFELEFIGHDDLIRVGRHAKFRHVIHP